MLPTVEEHRDTLRRLCRDHGVARLELFGSAARDDFDLAGSDLDFLVRFEPMTPQRHYEAYFGLQRALEAVFGRAVDLVEPDTVVNPYIRRQIAQDRVTLYAA